MYQEVIYESLFFSVTTVKDSIEEDNTMTDNIKDSFTDNITDIVTENVTDNMMDSITTAIEVVTSLPEFVWTEVQYNSTASTTTKVRMVYHAFTMFPINCVLTLNLLICLTLGRFAHN
jgi:hypothetical protein